MRILIIRSWGRTAFELGEYCKNAFEEIGHAASLFDYNDERISSRFSFLGNIEKTFAQRNLLRKISNFKPNLILVIKGDRVPLAIIHKIKDEFKIPVANYWIDDPYYIDISQKISSFYDYFFTNDPECVQIHKKSGCRHAKFLSFGCLPELHKKINLSEGDYKQYASDICFAGTVSEGRMKILEALGDFNLKIWSPPIVSLLGKEYKIEKKEIARTLPIYKKFKGHAVWARNLIKAYNASKIVLNIHSPQPVPIMRDFEVTGCGAFLLTDHARELKSVFKLGKEIVCYRNIDELKNKIEFYLSHPQKREEIARQGQKRSYKCHTYAIRMQELISFIEKMES